jgi:FKBP-type peptidyl-prolyl cis-trans isomerase
MSRPKWLFFALIVACAGTFFLPKRDASYPPPPVPEDVASPPPSANKTPSGVAYRLLKEGSGARPAKPTDRVTVIYSGWTPDGKLFDSSVVNGRPATFGLDEVIAGWAEGVSLMRVGDKMRLWIPSALAYGDVPKHAGFPAGMLVFDIELLAIEPVAG